MLGPSLLVSSVYAPQQTDKSTYLPSNTHWYDFWTGKIYSGGQTIQTQVPLSQHGALFVKENSFIPTGKIMSFVGENADDYRLFYFFPPLQFSTDVLKNETIMIEDDGISQNSLTTEYKVVVTGMSDYQIELELDFVKKEFKLEYSMLWFVLPIGDTRQIILKGKKGHVNQEKGRCFYGFSLL
jgi:alpha-glucosidase (family GH31 glycosyl hydrolase)